MSRFSSILFGNESLTVQCGTLLVQRGHEVRAVVTRNPEVRAWAEGHGMRVLVPGADLAARLGQGADWLFSIAYLSVIPADVLALAGRGAINFHDGPLPRYAGLNAPVWALLNGEASHGVTWHMIGGGVDEGDIVDQRLFDLAPDETALTLNTKCFAAAIDGFAALVEGIEAGGPQRLPQDLSQRSYYARAARPAAAARIDFTAPATAIAGMVRALDHGGYWNPLACPKIEAGGRVLLVGGAEVAEGASVPGTVLASGPEGLVVAAGSGAVLLHGLRDPDGAAVDPAGIAVGTVLASLDAAAAEGLTARMASVVSGEGMWRRALQQFSPLDLPLAQAATASADYRTQPLALPGGVSGARGLAVVAAWLGRMADGPGADLALMVADAPQAQGYLSPWVPLRVPADPEAPFATAAAQFAERLAAARACPAYAADLVARDPAIAPPTLPSVGLMLGEGPVPGTALTVAANAAGDLTLIHDAARLPGAALALLLARLDLMAAAVLADPATPLGTLPVLPEAERALVLHGWNATEAGYDRSLCVHQAFEAQVARTPDAVALVFEGLSLTYDALNRAANRAAHVLIDMGVRPGTLVGLHAGRSADLLVGALAIQKAGGAYVPLDPAYPADRIALYIEDSAAPVIVAQAALVAGLPPHSAQVLAIDADPRLATAPDSNPDSGVGAGDLAYMIYTSGSTGRPKGVMIEHRNVVNFFTGMDARISHEPPGVWLAVTSLSFDISVLELFYTLARGFKVVISSDENRALISSGAVAVSDKGMEFSLYYWGNDDGSGERKYELLLEGAKFADANGFVAVWTPERHFHAFGGPYPNPAVTGAAVAGITKNIGVRAGSCVAPLHHPARIAEDWAVIDNLTGGRVGLAMASGWQPDDFVLRPENTTPNNRKALFDSIEQVRRLWRGEAVEFPTASGKPFAVVTQPRPISRELPVWVTTAGNPDTWREAGAIGANVLTHLLGQTVEEVAGKIALYHQALRDAGHDPADHTVTLMLHTYLAADRATAREVARGPMKDYLRSAAALIKQYAWAFPAFKKPAGATNPMQIDLQSLSTEEMEGILDFAFQRYFEDSGLFGTVDDAVARVEELKRIGVGEVACLIDYGIPVPQVLEGLKPLAEVLARANAGAALAEDDFSIAAQIVRHGVTHLQCTPSMARMIAMNDEARGALGRVQHLMLGGEPLPGALVADLAKATRAGVQNMYGPTETTIWSSTEMAGPGAGVVNIGTPIANTRLYVLDEAQRPVPVGVAGELWIGGEGVARGYWQRDDLTAERFLPDPFPGVAGARMYRTGDLVRWRADGRVDFVGRADHQIKLRGYRIELGEIEARLEAVAGVRQAVVMAREDAPGDLRLVCYMTVDRALPEAGLRAELGAFLPDFMVPAHFVTLDSFPLTPNKKVDRKALPAPGAVQQAARAEAFEPPVNDVEQQIATIWSRVLGVARVGARDNFFALGGHSLLAVQAHREIREALGATRLSITDIFRFPTLSALAAHLDDRPRGEPAANAPVLAERAEARNDAMARRRALRAGRGGR